MYFTKENKYYRSLIKSRNKKCKANVIIARYIIRPNDPYNALT